MRSTIALQNLSPNLSFVSVLEWAMSCRSKNQTPYGPKFTISDFQGLSRPSSPSESGPSLVTLVSLHCLFYVCVCVCVCPNL